MSQQNTTTTLDGLFKRVYGDMVNPIPEVAIIQKKVKFKETERIGKQYEFPVILSNEAGVTYLAAGDGVTTLNDSIAAVLKNAQIDANQIIIRGQMDYEAAAKATGSEKAFKNASELLVQNLMETGSRRLEMAFLYGQSAQGLGVAESAVNASATSTVLQMSAASWAPGVWAGAENALVNFYQVNNDAQISSGTDGVFTISVVNFADKKITVTGTATGISALEAVINHATTPYDLYVHWKGAKGKEPVGLDKIITNTGTLFGIDASVYALWTGSSYAFAGAATVAKILNMVGMAVSKGGLMEEADVLLSPKTFIALAGSMTDLRRQPGDAKEGIGGFETISLLGPNGKLNLIPHLMVKEGECLGGPMKRLKRVGSQEFSFQTPGRNGEMFLHVPDKNAYELRLYGAQAIVAETPAKFFKGTGITN